MNILFITHFFPPNHTTGTENYTFGLARKLVELGHQVQVICAEDWQKGDKYWNGTSKDVYQGVSVYRFNLNWTKADDPNQALYNSSLAREWLSQFLTQKKIDLVHTTSTYSLGVGVLQAVKSANIPQILTLTDFWFVCPRLQLVKDTGDLCTGRTTAWECQACVANDSKLFRLFNKFFPPPLQPMLWEQIVKYPLLTRQRGLRGLLLNMNERKQLLTQMLMIPDQVIAPSKMLQQLFAHIVPSVTFTTLSYGHDLSWLQDYQGKSYSDKIRFGYLGQVSHSKGVHVLIKAFQKARLGSKAHLSIWGGWEKHSGYVHELEALINDSSPIKLNGRFQRKQLAEILSNIDVVVVPSLWYENTPLVIQEAFATKTPVIATNLGGMAETITPEVTGLLFERGNTDDLAKQLRRVVEDPQLVSQFQTQIPHVKSVEEHVVELEQRYQNLLGESMLQNAS